MKNSVLSARDAEQRPVLLNNSDMNRFYPALAKAKTLFVVTVTKPLKQFPDVTSDYLWAFKSYLKIVYKTVRL